MARNIGTTLTLADKFSPTLNNIAKNVSGFNNKMGSANNGMSKMSSSFSNNLSKMNNAAGSAFKGVGTKIAGLAAGFGLASFAKESVMLASDLVEVQNVVDTTFGKSSKKINDFATTSMENFGLTTLEAKKFSGTLGAMMKSSGITGDELSKLSLELTGMAGDFASFYNKSPEEAFEKIKSAIAGESMPMREFGIDMNVASLEAYALSKGIDKSFDSMTQAEKTLLRYKYIMDKGKDSQGDFKKTNKEFANQLRIFESNFKSAGASIASIFLPSLNNVLQKFNKFMSSNNIQWVTNKVKELAEGFGSWLAPQLRDFSDWCTNKVYPALQDIGKGAIDFYTSHAPELQNAFNSAKEFAKNFAELGLWIVKDGFQWLKDNGDTVKEVIEAVGKAFDAAGNILSGNFNAALSDTLGFFEKLSDDSFANVWNYVKNGMPREATELEKNTEEYGNQLGFQKWLDTGGFIKDTTKNQGIIPRSREWRKKNEKQDEVYKNTPENKSYKRGEMPAFASGTSYTPSGMLLKNEKGGEITVSRGGEAIIPADKSEKLLKGQSMGGHTFNFYFTGNVGNEEFFNEAGRFIADKVTLALGNM